MHLRRLHGRVDFSRASQLSNIEQSSINQERAVIIRGNSQVVPLNLGSKIVGQLGEAVRQDKSADNAFDSPERDERTTMAAAAALLSAGIHNTFLRTERK